MTHRERLQLTAYLERDLIAMREVERAERSDTVALEGAHELGPVREARDDARDRLLLCRRGVCRRTQIHEVEEGVIAHLARVSKTVGRMDGEARAPRRHMTSSASLFWDVHLDDRKVAVEARGAAACDVLAFVGEALEVSDAASPASVLLMSDGDERITVQAENGEPMTRDPMGAAEALMATLTTALIWDYARGLALHAALIDLAGKAVLLPAKSGSGKSTLAVFAGASGCGFHTDELVLSPAKETLCPLRRPAHLKSGSLFVLDTLRLTGEVRRNATNALVSSSALGPPHPSAQLHALVFPRYRPGAACTLERLTPTRAAFELLGALVNARNVEHDGIPQTARLASDTAGYTLTYDRLDEALAALRSIC